MAGRNKAARTAGISDEQVRALLDRYECPVAFHEVRTRFLGNIATPSMTASPIKIIQDLWGGELPVFDSTDAANELIGALIMGLWNRLTRHQERNAPFRLNRIETAPTRDGLADLSRMRVQEIDGFVARLFGGEDRIDLPERAHSRFVLHTRTQANACGIAGEQSRPPLRQAQRVLRMKRIGYASMLAKRGEKFS